MPVASDHIPNIIDPAQASAATFFVEGYGTVDFLAAFPTIETGVDDTGSQIAQLSLRADDIYSLCARHTNYCSDNGSPVRRGNVQLVDGHVLIDGEAYVDFLNRWQTVQLVLQLEAKAMIHIDSIVLEGVRFSIPENALGNFIRGLQSTINQALQGMSARIDKTTYVLSSIGVSGDRLVVTFRRG